MSIKARAVIRREVMFDSKKPRGKHYYAALQLFSEDGNEHGVTRYFSGGFSQVAAFLQSEAGGPHEHCNTATRVTRKVRRCGLP
jgi:hypothetical protein